MELAEWEMNGERQTFKSVAYKKAARALASLDYRYFHVTLLFFMFRFRIRIHMRIQIRARIEFGSRSGSSSKFKKNLYTTEPLVHTSTLARPLLTLLDSLQALVRILQESHVSKM
jgi:hypothetical protein